MVVHGAMSPTQLLTKFSLGYSQFLSCALQFHTQLVCLMVVRRLPSIMTAALTVICDIIIVIIFIIIIIIIAQQSTGNYLIT